MDAERSGSQPVVARVGASAWRRRRPRGAAPRAHRITIYLDDAEYAAVLEHAAAARLAPAAYAAAVSVAAPVAAVSGASDEERAELLLHLLGLHRQMRGACTNLNQAVMKLHALNEPVGELPAVVGYVRRVATAVDELIAAVAGERV